MGELHALRERHESFVLDLLDEIIGRVGEMEHVVVVAIDREGALHIGHTRMTRYEKLGILDRAKFMIHDRDDLA